MSDHYMADKVAVVVLENDDVVSVFLLPAEEANADKMNNFRSNLRADNKTKFRDPDTDQEVVRRTQRVLVQEVSDLRGVFHGIQNSR